MISTSKPWRGARGSVVAVVGGAVVESPPPSGAELEVVDTGCVRSVEIAGDVVGTSAAGGAQLAAIGRIATIAPLTIARARLAFTPD
jgi:hypothetical protein